MVCNTEYIAQFFKRDELGLHVWTWKTVWIYHVHIVTKAAD